MKIYNHPRWGNSHTVGIARQEQSQQLRCRATGGALRLRMFACSAPQSAPICWIRHPNIPIGPALALKLRAPRRCGRGVRRYRAHGWSAAVDQFVRCGIVCQVGDKPTPQSYGIYQRHSARLADCAGAPRCCYQTLGMRGGGASRPTTQCSSCNTPLRRTPWPIR